MASRMPYLSRGLSLHHIVPHTHTADGQQKTLNLIFREWGTIPCFLCIKRRIVKNNAVDIIRSIAYFFATNPPPNAPAQLHMDFDQPVNLFSVIVFTINKPTEIRDAP